MQSKLYFRSSILYLAFLLSVNLQAQRVSEGLSALFTFGEGSGPFVADHSAEGLPLILTADHPDHINWLGNGGLNVAQPTILRSLTNASEIKDAVEASQELSLELWLKPSSTTQNGPSRILTCSLGSSSRNFMLGQENDRYVARVRTTATNENGTPNFFTPNGSVSTQLTHLVYTLDGNGNEHFYLNGELVASGSRDGEMTNWDASYHLALANEIGADRDWLGDLRLAAVYHQSLSAEEVVQNYNAGLMTGGAMSDATCPEDCWVDGFGTSRRVLWIPNLPNNIHLNFKFTEEGGTFDTFEDGTAHLYGALENMEDPSLGFYMDIWFTDRMSWPEWSSLGRSWKGNPAIVGNSYQDWDYYIVDPDQENVLIGTGGLEGSLINLYHKPADYYYGMQVGLAANDQNAEQGMSCWFFYEGQVLGQVVDHNCDINMEGDCAESPVVACAVDVEIDCNASIDPSVTGEPVLFCPDGYTVSYSDEWLSTDCPATLQRTWTVSDSNGVVAECQQIISVIDETAPVIALTAAVSYDCESAEAAFTAVVSDDCDANPTITVTGLEQTWLSSEPCEPGMYRTQTPGGWGANPNGNNPGAYLHANFDQAFPNGLTIGCENTLHFTSAQAITDFLPSGSTPTTLPEGDMVDPGDPYNNVFAGHLVALTLSVTFDLYDPNFGGSDLAMSMLPVAEGPFAGWTIGELLAEANALIGGCGSSYSPSDFTGVLSSINENFVDGTTNNGFVDCELPWDCFLLLSGSVSASDNCGNTSSAYASVIVIDETAPEFTEMEEHITVLCDEIPAPLTELASDCAWDVVELSVQESQYSGGCGNSLQRIYTATDQCGNTSTFTQFITVLDDEAPVFTSVPQPINLVCGQAVPDGSITATDNCDDDVLITYSDEALGEGCQFEILRTYTATDNCGNTASVQQLITVSDQSAPEISGVTPMLVLNCEDEIPVMEVSASDDCDPNPELLFNEVNEQVGCSLFITRTWTAIDQCGNTTIATQQIEITDDQSPVFLTTPSDMTVACGNVPAIEVPEAWDACGSVEVNWVEIELEGGDGICGGLLRVFTATDECGNSSIYQQHITLIDNEAPALFNVPAGGTMSCGELTDASAVVAMDNCDEDIDLVVTEEFVGDACQPTLTRTWTATDDCGNSVTATQVVQLIDNQPPVFVNAPIDQTVSCQFGTPVPLVEVVDACGGTVDLQFTEVQSGEGCSFTLTRTWTAIDECGNTSSHTQLVNVVDDEAPVFISAPADLNLSCGASPLFEEPVVEDNCAAFELSYNEETTTDECGITIIRTWTATDECGNTSEHVQTIFIGDDDAPILIGIPAAMSLSCDDEIPAPANVTAEDACSSVSVNFNEGIIPGSCANSYIIARTWMAIDACGNVSMSSQQITVSDTTAPVFDNLPEDITADCGNIPEPPVLTASDNCGPVTVSLEVSFEEGGCPNLIRTWTATDACGNSAQAVQIVYVDDNEPPLLIGVPEDLTVDCNNIPDMPEPEAADNCDDNVDVTANVNIIGTGCEYTIIRTWIASDDCGNTTIISQSINVIDESDPFFVSAPADTSVECSQLDGLPLPPALDDCGATVNVMFEDQVIGSNPCEYDIVRTYTAMDQCGHTATAVQNIHVYDQTPPVFSGVPANMYVNCGQVPPPANVSAIDACTDVVDLNFEEQQFGEGCEYYLQRTWTATDACGNAASITHLVYVSDNTAPQISAMPNLTVDCDEAWPVEGQPTITDNCQSQPTVTYTQFTETNECSETLTRIWIATDGCGNTTTRTQTITRADITPPVISGVPADVLVNCGEIPVPAEVTATDNCSSPVEIMIEDLVIPGACPYTIVRTWTATDACGNSATASQNIMVQDNEAPVLSDLPANTTAECGALPEPQFPLATDNCVENINVMLEEEWISQEGCSWLVMRTFTATDYCGNSTSYTQEIQVVDTTAPIFPELSAEVIVQCDEVPAFEMITVDDACDAEVVVTMNEAVIQGSCPTEQTRIRTWTATDACGNSSSFVQTIYVTDDNLPAMSGLPADITVECGNIPPVAEVSGWDPCQGDLPVSFSENVILDETDTGCDLSNAISPAGDVAIWLPTLNGFASDYVLGESGQFVENDANGTAHITGTVYNPANAAQGWIIDIYLENKMNWEQWSALGRSYKDDLGFGADHYQDWTYYEIVNYESKLIGIGEFEGSVLELTHAPYNYYYGLQIGVGANNRNGEYGMSGWFDFTGTLNGGAVAGMGDIMTENNCCAEQTIERTWTVTDCAGNTISYTQTITVTDGFVEPSLMYIDTSEEGEFDVSGTAGEEFMLAFRLPADDRISIQMYDLGGNLISILFEAEVRGETEYRVPVSKRGLTEGIYLFRLVGDQVELSDKELNTMGM